MNSVLKWHGGKHYLAKWIISLMPSHRHYVEPYCGSCAVLLEKNPIGISEVINDLNGHLINFWRVLRDPNLFDRMLRILQATPCSEQLFNEATDICNDEIEKAVNFFILCRQSRAATFKEFTTLSRTRTRSGMNELASAWWNAIDSFPEVHDRLARVIILNQNAIKCIYGQDSSDTLFYCDPPYLHETRVSTKSYNFEMTYIDHIELLDTANMIKGKMMISGYPSDFYNVKLKNWNRHSKEIPNHASGGNEKRIMTEVLWTNF